MNILFNIIFSIIGYIIGSIPWALIIGKFFYNKDIRNYGSHNLGGTNAARVLGFKAGVIVIILDAFKALITMLLCNLYKPEVIPFAGLAVCIGHCYPIFAQFKGGKAVACAYGYLLGMGILVSKDIIFIFICPLLMFFMILGLFKMVSLSSIISLIFASIIAYLTFDNKINAILIIILAIFVIIRHISNIKRIINKEEPKISIIK